MAFSTFQLLLPLIFGIIFCAAAVVLLIITIVQAVSDEPMFLLFLILCVMTFIGGVILCSLGIVGMYFTKLYTEVQNRPKYLVKEEF